MNLSRAGTAKLLTAGCRSAMVASCRCLRTNNLPLKRLVTVCKAAIKKRSNRRIIRKRRSFLIRIKRCTHLTPLITAMLKITIMRNDDLVDPNISDLSQRITSRKTKVATDCLTGGQWMMKP